MKLKEAIESYPFPLEFYDDNKATHFFSCEITAGAPQKLFRSLEEVVTTHGFEIEPRLTSMSDIRPLPIQNSGEFTGNIVGEGDTQFHMRKVGIFRWSRWFTSNIISIHFSGEVYQSEHTSKASSVESKRFTMISDIKLKLGVWEALTRNRIDVRGKYSTKRRTLFGEVEPPRYTSRFQQLVEDLKSSITPKVELLTTQRVVTRCSYCGSSKELGERCKSCGADA